MLCRYIDQLTNVEPGQLKRYRRQAKVMDEALDKRTAAEVTDEDVRHWVKHFRRAPKTIADYHGLLSAGFECIYFNNKEGGEFGDIFQVCLDGEGAAATVSSKNSC